MKFKLQAGAEVDIMTADEMKKTLKDTVQDWLVQAAIGPKIVEIFATGTIAADSTLTIGGPNADLTAGKLGPDESMVWSVKATNISGLQTADVLSLWRGANSASRLVRADVAGYQRYGSDELVLRGGINMLFTGATLSTPVGTVVKVTGQAWELPVTMLYKLM